ncbi:MAG: glucose-1-phosphate adenylyltransferase subunit GlgD [Ruminococcaceae bacterium]|nr:glucose-1-phosphate adenylyltransferase subunit GlgD [Oscillospiraceae bacterium]
MIKDYMAIFNLGENENDIRSLTTNRPIASIPFASRYRVIDFMLSNIVNSGIKNVGIFSPSNSRSLVDHVGTGKPWDLNRKNDGMFIFHHGLDDLVNHDSKLLKNNMEYIYRSKNDSVIISSSYMVCNIDIADLIDSHEQSGCDITVAYKHSENANIDFQNCYTLAVDKTNNKVTGAGKNIGFTKSADVCMEIFVMKKELFVDFLYKSATNSTKGTLYNVIFGEINNFNVNAYEFTGYLACINSIKSYYEASMDMLDFNLRNELFMAGNRPIYTKIKDEHPTLYVDGCKVCNSLIADGCIIKGKVNNSLLARYVTVENDVELDNCIILQNCTIKAGSKLSNVIIDKNATIEPGTELKGSTQYPLVVEKRNFMNGF